MGLCIFEEHFCLRERLAVSILFKKGIKIKKIRSSSFDPGIRHFEVQLFSLIDKLIPGSIFKINENGTTLKFYPGNFLREKVIHHLGKFRSLSYYLEFILYISHLRPEGMEIKLSGIRSSPLDVSLESILYVTIPLHRKLGARDTRVKIFSNSFSSTMNTELVLICPKMSSQEAFQVLEPGVLKKIRIIFTHSSNIVPPRELTSKFFDKNPLLSEVDLSFFNFKISNKTFKFHSLTLIGETSTGCIFGNDFSTYKKNIEPVCWKKLLSQTFILFFEDLKTGGCVDNRNQIFLGLKILNRKKENSKLRIGKLTLSSILFFRDVKKLTGIVFKFSSTIDMKSLILRIG